MKEPAIYHKQEIEEFIGNPLIEALPPPEDPANYPKLLMSLPGYSEDERKNDARWRLARLQRISQVHVPTKKDSMLMLSIGRCIRWSYADRNPIPFDEVKKILKNEGRQVSESLERYLTSPKAPIYGFPVLGVSGAGKTTSVENVLSLFPQAISHTNYRGLDFKQDQLVWLKVDCPPDGTPKGLCAAILQGVDIALKSDYTSQILRNRMSKDVLLIKVSKLIQDLHLGILLLEDIQNLCGTKATVSKELLNFMVSLANSLRIPVVMIGTPKILTLLQKEFQQAKRASGEGEIRMDLMTRGSTEWKRFISFVWTYQYTAEKVELTEEMEKQFFEESVGNPFVASLLYKLVQDDAIIGRKETFDISDVSRVAREKMGITAKMRRDMLAGIDVELNAYRRLWEVTNFVPAVNSSSDKKITKQGKASEEEFNSLVKEIATMLVNEGLQMNDACSYARQAIAAYPADYNADTLRGYAMALYKIKSWHSGVESAETKTQ